MYVLHVPATGVVAVNSNPKHFGLISGSVEGSPDTVWVSARHAFMHALKVNAGSA